jgi:hypothetical protein
MAGGMGNNSMPNLAQQGSMGRAGGGGMGRYGGGGGGGDGGGFDEDIGEEFDDDDDDDGDDDGEMGAMDGYAYGGGGQQPSQPPPVRRQQITPHPSPRPRPQPPGNEIPMGIYTPGVRSPLPRAATEPPLSTRLNRTQSVDKRVGPSGQEWIHGNAFLDACVCTTNCNCRKGQRVLYRAQAQDGEGHDGFGEIRYIMRDELGRDCGDHGGCHRDEEDEEKSSRSRKKKGKEKKKKKKGRKAIGKGGESDSDDDGESVHSEMMKTMKKMEARLQDLSLQQNNGGGGGGMGMNTGVSHIPFSSAGIPQNDIGMNIRNPQAQFGSPGFPQNQMNPAMMQQFQMGAMQGPPRAPSFSMGMAPHGGGPQLGPMGGGGRPHRYIPNDGMMMETYDEGNSVRESDDMMGPRRFGGRLDDMPRRPPRMGDRRGPRHEYMDPPPRKPPRRGGRRGGFGHDFLGFDERPPPPGGRGMGMGMGERSRGRGRGRGRGRDLRHGGGGRGPPDFPEDDEFDFPPPHMQGGGRGGRDDFGDGDEEDDDGGWEDEDGQ